MIASDKGGGQAKNFVGGCEEGAFWYPELQTPSLGHVMDEPPPILLPPPLISHLLQQALSVR